MGLLSPFRLVRRIIELVVLAVVVYLAISAVQVVTASRAPGAVSVAPREPVVVIVESGSTSGPVLTSDFTVRLHHALALYSDHRAPRLLVTGTSTKQALAGRGYLERHGVPASAISTVVATDVPWQLSSVVSTRHVRRALVVADAWQTLWVTHVATSAGLEAVMSPVTAPGSGKLAEAGGVLIQASAVAVGRVAGFGRTGFIGG